MQADPVVKKSKRQYYIIYMVYRRNQGQLVTG